KPDPTTTLRKTKHNWGKFASISPDGKYMCDVDWITENLVLHELATGKVRPLTSKDSDDACYPLESAISHDNSQIAYLWWDPNTRTSSLYCVGLDGSGNRLLRRGGYPMPRDWSGDGKKILAVVSEKDTQQMVWISASDGSIQNIASFYAESLGYPGKLDISSDGRFIAYDRPQAEDTAKRDLFVFDLNKNCEVSLVKHPANDKLLGWTPDGQSILFTSDRIGTWDAWLLGVTGGQSKGYPQLIKHGIGDVTPIGFTPGGSYYYGHEQTLKDVFVAKLDLATGEVLSEPMPVRQSGTTTCHDWSPDGLYLAYCTRRPDESPSIHIRTLATGQERTLADNDSHIRWLRWSLDGRSILFDGYKRGDSQGVIHRIDVKTGERTALVRNQTKVLIRPEMSPDGKTLFFDRDDPNSKTMCLVARNLESGGEKELFRVVPPARLTGKALSPDGQWFVLSTIVPSPTRPATRVLQIISATGGEPRELIQFDKSERLWAVGVAWMPDSQDVLFWKWFLGGKDRELWRISADGGEPQKLWARKTLGHLRVHPDGQRIAYNSRVTTSEIWVMENFLPAMPVTKPKSAPTIRQVWFGPDVDSCGEPSPDGRYLTYVDWETGDLAVYELATGKKRRLTNNSFLDESKDFALFSRWSPDGKQIVYDWYNNENKFVDLCIIGIEGSEPRILHSNEQVWWAQTYDWSPDGKQILACFRMKDGPEQIVLVSVADGSVRILKTFDLKWSWPQNMCFSPDGRYIVFSYQRKEGSPGYDICVMSVDGSSAIPVVEHPANDCVLGWAPDGKNILFGSDRTGNYDLWCIKVANGKPQGDSKLVKSGIGPVAPLGFTRKGYFYYSISQKGNDVYVAELDPQTGEILVPPKKAVKRFEGSNIDPYYSPDGKYLAYISRSRGHNTYLVPCIRSLETGKEREFSLNINLSGNLIGATIPRWSPDCRSLLVRGRDEKNRGGIYQIDAQTGDVTPIVLSDVYGEVSFRSCEWSRDGKSIFYGRANEDNIYQILVRDLETGTEKELYRSSSEFCFDISVSPDGKWLALGTSQSNYLRFLKVMPSTGGEPRELYRFKKGEGMLSITWTADGKYILYVRAIPRDQIELCRISADGGEPEKLGLEMLQIRSLSVHPDGRHIAFQSSGPKHKSGEVWVMENFLPAALASADR
ncbi:MAG: hypothetical protein ACYS80_00670, partial [Planctomycetota bacterium]